jgi:hypothetical protein
MARSSVFFVGNAQNASCAIHRRRRSATGHRQRFADPGSRFRETLGGALAADASELVEAHHAELQPVPVGIDNRVTDSRSDLRRLGMGVSTHRSASCRKGVERRHRE